MKNLYLLLCVWLACNSMNALAQVSIVADMTEKVAEAQPFHYGINFQRALAPEIASNPDFKARVAEINAPIVRYHAAEQIFGGATNTKNWIDFGTQTWNAGRINEVLANKPANAEILITITGWPSFISENKRLPLDKIDEYANFCADLVDLVNNQLGYNVTYWEPFNEKDGAGYDGPEQMAELAAIFQACRSAMLERDPSIKLVGGAFRQPFQSNVQFFLSNLNPGDLDVWSHHQYGGGGSGAATNEERIAEIYDRPDNIVDGLRVMRTKLAEAGFGGVPIWLDEWNIYFAFDLDLANRYMISAVGGVFDALTYKKAIEGTDVASLMSWNAADGTYGKIAGDFSKLNPGGNLLKVLTQYGIGDVRPTLSSDATKIEGFTVQQSDGKAMFVLINRSQANQNIDFSAGGWEPASSVKKITINQEGLTEEEVVWDDLLNDFTPIGSHEIVVLVTSSGGIIGNQLPLVSGGGNKKLSAPYTSVVLEGTATDADGTIAAYQWTQLEGPTASTGSTNQAQLSLEALLPDNQYVFQLDATDDQGGTGTDYVTVFTYGALPNVVVNGTSLENNFTGAAINGAVQQTSTDLGNRLSQNEELTIALNRMEQFKTVYKSTLSGNTGLDLRDDATVSFFMKSSVDIRLRVKLLDLEGQQIDDEQFDLEVPGDNQYQQYSLDFGDALSQINGREVNALQIIQSGTGTKNGTMVLDVLRVGDVAVSAGNLSPVAEVGPNRIITLPNDNPQVIEGGGTDQDGAVFARRWTQISGPNLPLDNTSQENLVVSDYSAGEYVLAYTLTDDKGATATDQMQLIIVDNPGPARASIDFLTNSFDGTLINDAVQTFEPSGKVTASQDGELSLTVSNLNQYEKMYQTTLTNDAALDLSENALFSMELKSTQALQLRVKLIDVNNQQIDNSNFDIFVSGDDTYQTYSKNFAGAFGNVEARAIKRLELMSLNGEPVSGTVTIDNLRLGIGRVVANAGPNRIVTLPSNSAITVEGLDLDEERADYTRQWQQLSGPNADLSGTNSALLQIDNYAAGDYVLEYQVTDQDGVTATDQMSVLILENSGSTLVGTSFLNNDFSGTTISDAVQTTEPNGSVTPVQDEELTLTLSNVKQYEKVYRTTLTNNAALDLSDNAQFSVRAKSTADVRVRIKLIDTDDRQIDNFAFDITIEGNGEYRTYTKNFAQSFGKVNARAIQRIELMSLSETPVSAVLTLDDLQVGAVPAVVDPIVQVSAAVSSSENDAEESSAGAISLDSGDLDFRADNFSGVRFALDVPPGAILTNATLRLIAKGNSGGNNTLTFRAQTSNSASAFATTFKNLTRRSMTSNAVTWMPGSWTDGEGYTSPDLSALLQEVVDRPNYKQGNYVIITIASDASNANERAARTYDYAGNSSQAPELTVAYRLGISTKTTNLLGKEPLPLSPENPVVMYPNPAWQQVYFDQEVNVTIFNSRGQEVLQGSQVRQLDLTALPRGLYLVRYATGRTDKLLIEK